MSKTLYIWDLADTLFPERWNSEKSGFPNFLAFVESLGYDPATISPLDYEWAYERPYSEDWFDLQLADGFQDVLTRTKHNAVFTTGNPEQVEWRRQTLKRKFHIDVRDYLPEVLTTFDFGNTNQKTAAMYQQIISTKIGQGFASFVYIDDKAKNCTLFTESLRALTNPPDFHAYEMRNDNAGLRIHNAHFATIGSLRDIPV